MEHILKNENSTHIVNYSFFEFDKVGSFTWSIMTLIGKLIFM